MKCVSYQKKCVRGRSDSLIMKLRSSIGDYPIVVAHLLHSHAVNFGKCSIITVPAVRTFQNTLSSLTMFGRTTVNCFLSIAQKCSNFPRFFFEFVSRVCRLFNGYFIPTLREIYCSADQI